MNRRDNGWFGFIGLLFVTLHVTVRPIASADEAGQSSVAASKRSVLARAAEVRLREQPDENAAIIEQSLAGVRLEVRKSQGDWLQVESSWIRVADVVESAEAIEYFGAQIARAESTFSYLGRAAALLANNEYDKAEADVGEALRLDARCSRAYLMRGWIAEELKQNDQAALHYERAVELDARDAFALVARADNVLRHGDAGQAIVRFDAALAVWPTQPDALCGRGFAWYRKQENRKALADFEEALRLDSTDATALAGRGLALGNSGEYDAAIADATEAIGLDAKLQFAYVVRGAARMHRGEFEPAARDLDEAVRLNPSDVSARRYRGQVYASLNRVDEALADCTQAISLDPHEPGVYLIRAALWLRKRDPANAVIDFGEFLHRRPDRADIYVQRGRLRLVTDPKAALGDFQQALRLDPRNVEALLARASYWQSKGEWPKMADDCSAVLAIEPQNIVALMGRGEAWLKQDQSDKALADADSACRANPAAPNMLVYRAHVHNMLGNYDRAIDDCQAALKLDTRHIDARKQLCYARCQRRDYARCIEDCTAALALSPKSTYFLQIRATCRLQCQRSDEALLDYRELARLDPIQAASLAQTIVTVEKLRQATQTSGPVAALRSSQESPTGDPATVAVKGFTQKTEKKKGDGNGYASQADKIQQEACTAIGKRKFAEAVTLFTRASAIANDSLRPSIEHDLAWLLAVCPDDDVRDGQRAVELAEKVLAARGEPDAGLCDTLAAAYAARGAFAEAVHWQTKAIELQRTERRREQYRQRLALYEAGKPYRLR